MRNVEAEIVDGATRVTPVQKGDKRAVTAAKIIQGKTGTEIAQLQSLHEAKLLCRQATPVHAWRLGTAGYA